MVKKIFAQTYLWILLLLLYSPIVIIMIYSFTEAKVLGNHCFDCSYGFHPAGEYHRYRHLQPKGTFAEGHQLCEQHSYPEWGYYYRYFTVSVVCVAGISQGYTTVVLAHITFCTPYVVLSVLPRLKQMNPNIYEAALDLGATPMQALRKVIVPEIRPGMISGFMLALTLSIDDFAVTVFTIGNEGLETLSTYIYADARKGGLTPELRPLSTIIFVVVLALLIVINRRAGKEKK